MEAIRRLYIRPAARGNISIVPAVAAISLPVLAAVVWFAMTAINTDTLPYIFMVPWVLGLAVVFCIPSVILYNKGKFTFADPLIFATWSYFFPAFVIGGLVFAFGWSQPDFLSFIQEVEYTLPLTIALLALGFGGLALGYFLPVGERLGRQIADRLPSHNYPLNSYIPPGLLLLLLGVFNTAIAFALGVFGFQKNAEFTQYDGLVYLTTLFWVQGAFLLWYVLFRSDRVGVTALPVVVLLVSSSLATMLYSGGRGGIIKIVSIIGLAFILSGKKFGAKQFTIAGTLFAILLVLSTIYGTTFRSVKGTESAQNLELYTENIFTTFDEIERSGVRPSLEFGFSALAERIDIVSSLAVVVSNHEALKPYEEVYGLDNNIWVDTTTFLIPRVLWKDKPAASDARKYSDLYFSHSENSFAITPIGDLLRNFGMLGIPIGMCILGLILRTMYRALVDGQANVHWRVTMYFMLLTAISYEGFFGTIIPNLVKVGVASVIGVLLVMFVASLVSRLMAKGERPGQGVKIV